MARISSAVLVHTKGSHRSLQPSMKTSIALMSSVTLVEGAAAGGLAGDDGDEDFDQVHP